MLLSLAEAIKHGAIYDDRLFGYMENNAELVTECGTNDSALCAF